MLSVLGLAMISSIRRPTTILTHACTSMLCGGSVTSYKYVSYSLYISLWHFISIIVWFELTGLVQEPCNCSYVIFACETRNRWCLMPSSDRLLLISMPHVQKHVNIEIGIGLFDEGIKCYLFESCMQNQIIVLSSNIYVKLSYRESLVSEAVKQQK